MLGGVRADVEDEVVFGDVGHGLHGGFGVGQELLGNDDVGGQGDVGAAGLGVGDDFLRRVEQVRFVQRLADRVAGGGDEGVGDAAADNELVDLADEAGQQFKLGADLAAGDDGEQWLGGREQGLGERVQFGHEQRATGGDGGEADDAMGGGLGAVRGAEGVHDEDVAEGGILFGERFVVLAFADVHAAIFEQDDGAGGNVDAVDPVAHERDLDAEQLGEAQGHGGKRFGFAPDAFGGAAEVRGDHDGGALFQCELQRRQRCGDALFGGDAAILDRYVEVLADQHALAGEIEVGHANDGHGQLFG